jgi:DNA-binding GntR family transcriptional regulator
MSSKVQKNSVQTETYHAIRSALVEGALAPGQKVTNRLLADLVGVSVTPVREALRRLVAEGALLDLPNGSVMAPEIDVAAYLNELGWLLSTLEARLAARAAERLGAADLAYLETLADAAGEARQTQDAPRATALWRDFCFHVFDRAEAPITSTLVAQLRVRAAPVLRLAYPTFDRASGGRHLSIVLTALRGPDPERAARAVVDLHAGLTHEVARLAAAGEDKASVGVDRKSRARRRR